MQDKQDSENGSNPVYPANPVILSFFSSYLLQYNPMNLITIENLSKQFSERLLFDRANLLVNEGDRIGLIGVNGSGKSTLLRIVAGLEAPDGGAVSSPGGIRIEFLAQEPPLDDALSVLQTVFRSESPQMRLLRAYEQASNLLQHARLLRAGS